METSHPSTPLADPDGTPPGGVGDDEPVLQLLNVTREFEGTPPVVAIDDVSLTVGAGELVGIVGQSGSGKSTLLNLMGTLDRPTRGSVFIEGFDVSSLSDAALSGVRSARIGFVFQQFHLLERSSALDNVADGLVYHGIGRSERRDRAADALERVGLGHRIEHRASKLSGGERQRVAIARAIAATPAVVLADEPTGNLDSSTSEAIVELLIELNTAGTTMVVITHDRELAATLPRRVGLKDGRIVDPDADFVAGTADTTRSGNRVSPPPPAFPSPRRLHINNGPSDNGHHHDEARNDEARNDEARNDYYWNGDRRGDDHGEPGE